MFPAYRCILCWIACIQGAPPTPTLVGCDAAMAELRMFLLAPLANPSLLRRLGLRAATGALLHGPPGCGKTSVARALASETRGVANFLEVRCSDLVDKVKRFWVSAQRVEGADILFVEAKRKWVRCCHAHERTVRGGKRNKTFHDNGDSLCVLWGPGPDGQDGNEWNGVLYLFLSVFFCERTFFCTQVLAVGS